MKKLITALAITAFSLGYSQSAYYDDYRSSITGIDWADAAAYLLLTPAQINSINALNSRYADYNAWNAYYGNNPDRWSEDRYRQMRGIMTPDQYAKFRNRYYKGQDPVTYYRHDNGKHKGWYKNGKAYQTAPYNNGRYNGRYNDGRYNERRDDDRYEHGRYNNGRYDGRYNNRRYDDRYEDKDDHGKGHGNGKGHGKWK